MGQLNSESQQKNKIFFFKKYLYCYFISEMQDQQTVTA